MTVLEIIQLRSSGTRSGLLSKQIRASVAVEPAHSAEVTVYCRNALDTDIAVHIQHNEVPARSGPSALGVRLAAALREFGLVEHTIWEKSDGVS